MITSNKFFRLFLSAFLFSPIFSSRYDTSSEMWKTHISRETCIHKLCSCFSLRTLFHISFFLYFVSPRLPVKQLSTVCFLSVPALSTLLALSGDAPYFRFYIFTLLCSSVSFFYFALMCGVDTRHFYISFRKEYKYVFSFLILIPFKFFSVFFLTTHKIEYVIYK